MRLRFFFSMALALAGGALFSAEPAEAESACVRVKSGEDEHLECPRVWAPVYGTLRNCAPLTVDSRPMVRCPLRPRPWEKEPAVATACAQVKVGEETHLECSPFWVPIYFASLRTREEPPLRSFRIGVPTQGPGGVQDKARAAPDLAPKAADRFVSSPPFPPQSRGSSDLLTSPQITVERDLYLQERLELLREAAAAAGAMFALGETYRARSDKPEDAQEAVRWYLRAALAGHPQARERLGELYLREASPPLPSTAPSPPDDRTPEERMAALRALLLQERQARNPASSPASPATPPNAPASEAPTAQMLNAELADELTAQGWRYEQGLGVPQDYARAADSYRQAAALGDTRAMLNLSRLFSQGRALPQNSASRERGLFRSPEPAARWREEASDAGDSRGELDLYNLYDFQASSNILTIATERAIRGDRDAMLQLGWFYEQGAPSLPQDYAQAAQWYRRGADFGHPLAMRSLAWLYRFGLGVPQDAALAEEWRRKAGPLRPLRHWPYRPSDLP